MKTNNFVTFISSSSVPRSLPHHAHCSQLQSSVMTPMMAMKSPRSFISPINTRNTRINYRRFYLFATSNDTEGHDEVEQNGMEEAFSHLETLTMEDWITESNNINEQVDYSSILKYSRTDVTPASNFGKATEEEVQYYLDMQQQLEGTATIEIDDDGKLSLEEGNMLESSDVGADVTGIDDYPWTSINPILRLRGPVATGYGRGGKQLGVPTANVSGQNVASVPINICAQFILLDISSYYAIITCTQLTSYRRLCSNQHWKV
jgi:hypothetical protein